MKSKIRYIKDQWYSLSLISVMCILLSIFSSCNKKSMTDEEALKWIAAYTPARIDKDAKIRIEITEFMRQKYDANLLEKSLKFSPKIKGQLSLTENERIIDFIPDESLKEAKEYTCRLDMKKLTGIDSLSDFKFTFYVEPREIRFADIKAIVDPDNIAMMSVKGLLEYNVQAGDSITSDSSLILCDYQGAKVIMDPKATNKSRGFKITGIKRSDKDTPLKLSIDPKFGFSAKEVKITVPSVADFKLLDAERIEEAEPYLNLEFSSPLSSQQELDGLIMIDKINELRIERSGTNVKIYYPTNGITDLTLRISDLLKNNEGRSLDEEIEQHFKQEVIPPAIEMPFEGSILPDNRNLKLPFRAVNLAAVDVEVVKLFPTNVLSFLQENELEYTGTLRRYGRLIYHKTVRLDKDKSLNLHQWNDFAIDLKNLFTQERGAVYNIRLTFRKAFSLYDKSEPENFTEVNGITQDDNKIWDKAETWIYRDTPDYKSGEYNWNESDDPTKDSYYMIDWDGRMPEVNLVASNLGLIVKKAEENEIRAIVTDLVTALPKSGIKVTAYNYQLQKIGSGFTNETGFVDFKTDNKPFMVTASDGYSTTYLKVKSGYELSTSNFDVSGKKTSEGIKGFTYGERGVWRPGDDIHITLIIEDKDKKLPANHPVVLELYNPEDQLYDRQTLTTGVDGFYAFTISTDENVPTGIWEADFKVGNQTFHHPVRIETIKPNRLKINIKTPDVINANKSEWIGLESNWLTGPVAKNMNASMEMTLYTNPNPFEKYKNYTFKNPLVTYTESKTQLVSGKTDSIGSLNKLCTIGTDFNSPGMLIANITAKVTEPGGDASIVSKTVPFSPFGVYVGIALKNKNYETDKDIHFPVMVVNQVGARMKTRELEYKIYKLDWNWWYEGNAKDLNRYVQSTSADVISKGLITANNGYASVPFKVEYPDWGKYLVIVRDPKGGHATGGVFMVDWPEWRGRSEKGNASGSTELTFTCDKKQYNVGETANVYLPKCEGGRVLLSIENGSKVIKKLWVSLSGKNETKYPLKIEKSMAPNFYITATMLRPHKETDFDTPIRLFGVEPLTVVDPNSILHPVIEMPEELHPQEQFTVKIKEKDNKPMTYTLAIVDEGLLDITNFKTPRPCVAFNQREALGVKTFDMFDDVIGAFVSNFRSILSVGGDAALRRAAGKEKRFNPAVMFLGPFTNMAGVKIHKITLPNYVGSVRVMVIAGHEGSYGNSDKTVKVTSPLMLLSSLPRTLANCDTVVMPVNVFAMDKDMRNVTLNIQTEGPVKVSGKSSQNINFKETGEQLVNFKLICDKSKEGKARIIVKAIGNGHEISDTTFIAVSHLMPRVIDTQEKVLFAGKSEELFWHPNSNGIVSLQLATMPTLNFSAINIFMESYPHLCTEQLSSKAIFMLFGREFLNETQRQQCEKELPRIIKAIQTRQTENGGFVYWPGYGDVNNWVTTMAGIVLTEADRQGFRIDKSCFEKWKKYQENSSRNYRYSSDTDLIQAFRLYSLTYANSPVTAAMNRLKESKKLSRTAAYCLASAYAETGRKDVAEKLIERAERSEEIKSCDWFYSPTRDMAIKLEAYTLCRMTDKALPIARKVASNCTGNNYVTQDIAFATIAMNELSKVMGKDSPCAVLYETGKSPLRIADFKTLKEFNLDSKSGKVKIENNGKGTLEVSLVNSYIPDATQIVKANAKGLKMNISYVDLEGKPISITTLKQDTEFKARITVTNLGDDVQNMALTYAIPSGWEIWNERLYGYSDAYDDYIDIRDNSSNFYFAIKGGSSKTFDVKLRAAYQGNYMLPSTICEDMYNPNCRAITSNKRVSVSI
ncbi:MAG: hypothetical protein J1F12_05805 [Muribaculaceae bacterium]|nr:hypothetical protein [Muribaculaceae bacterium]